MSARRYVLVEGHGEVEAVGNLLARLSARIGDATQWARPLRWNNLHLWEARGRGGVRAALDFVRGKGDAAGLLLLRDADDGCPKVLGPEIASHLRGATPPFPTAYVLFKPEYEVLFLPCVSSMAGRALDGRPGLLPGTTWDGATWEARRGVKEWLSSHFPKGRRYKETVDQLAMTRLIDLDVLAQAEVPCFGTLQRAVAFFARSGSHAAVYP